MATIAPVVVSVALWLLTGSVFALVFAALGPAVAIASLADARLQSRRRLRRERRRFAAELDSARREIVDAHDREREALERSSPSSRRLVASTWSDSEKWLAGPGEAIEIGLGAGDGSSALVLDGLAAASRSRGPAEAALRTLDAAARSLDRAPIVVDARLGIGVIGAPVVAEAVARSLLVQLAAILSPLDYSIAVVASEERVSRWSWIEALPHITSLTSSEASEAIDPAAVVSVTVESVSLASAAVATLAVATRRDDLPRSARIVLRAMGATGFIEQNPDGAPTAALQLDHISIEQARQIADTLREQAGRAHLTGGRNGTAALPIELAFAELDTELDAELDAESPERHALNRPGLGCIVAVSTHGPLDLDLVAHGPHAVVGGTTGSGKSELLTAWVLAMARDHSPRRASVLLVDFKGGSAFAGLAALPHCVGVITDLDEAAAGRALESLSAELRRRERHLAAVGAKSIDDLPRPRASAGTQSLAQTDMPRLVIVVDEFAAMVAGYPELHSLFGDIAARGRSLGVHLILCTQRPAGVIRDAVLANTGLRVSLRVNNRADSSAVIGVDVASALPMHPRGRAYVSTDGDEPVLAQFPLATPRDIDAVARRWAGEPYRAHRPWLDPLPADIPVARLVAATSIDSALGDPGIGGPSLGDPARHDQARHDQARHDQARHDQVRHDQAWPDQARPDPTPGLPFGILDDPANQQQPVAVYRPAIDGNLLVLGGAGSGKSTLVDTLSAVAAQAGLAAVCLPNTIEGSWDALGGLLAEMRSPVPPDAPGALVLVDDLDQLLGRFAEEYEVAMLDMLVQALREGPGRGVRFVITTQRYTAALHQVGSLCGSRLLLRMPSRQEHVLAGGEGADFVERSRPGFGRWRSLAVQIARAPAAPDPGVRRHAIHDRAQILDDSRPLAVVSSQPAAFVARLHRALPVFALTGAVIDVAAQTSATSGLAVTDGRRPVALVGDPDAWQARWGALQALRSTHVVVVEGLGAAEFRAVTRTRALPPPLDGRDGAFWLCAPDGSVRRARLP